MSRRVVLVVLVLVGLLVSHGTAQRAEVANLDQLRYRFIGPFGNRLAAVVGEPGNTNVYYVGAASGGVWKSMDGGFTWRPVFDAQAAQSIGSLAIAPGDPNVVWAGTGETFIRSNVSIGDGIYKSTDAGRSWTRMGLEKSGRIGRIIVDPRNPDIVFAAALGHCYGPQTDRGVYRTLDGGKTWDRVLFVDENTGAADVAMDPSNPRVLFAGMWQVDIKTWGRTSGGPGSGVFVSRDGGTTWRRLTAANGLPESPLGKIAVAVAPNNGNRVYALIETGQRGSLWRSDDGGERWRPVNHSRLLNERPHYYTRMMVSPGDYNEVYFPSNSMSVTYDGGETAELIPWGGDNHDMWADPKNPDRMMIGNDLGVMITTTHGRQWMSLRLPIGQIYHAATDNRIPYFVYGNMQDYASVRGPSNSLSGGIPSGLWTTTGGCESGWNIPDPVDDNIIWSGCYAGVIERFDLRTRHARSVSPWPERTMGAPAGDVKLRMNWTFPVAVSPHDHNTVYVGSQYVHKTTDGGQTWTTISPDLSLADTSKLGNSGGLTIDNLSVEYGALVFVIAESPIEKGQIWAGTNDGQLQVTRDGGKTWANVTRNITGLPPDGTMSSIEPSRYEPGTCYIAVDLHQVNNREPWIYRTTDFGRTWASLGADVPRSIFSYAHVLREDPVRKGLLYLGTENSLYVSFNDGANWQPLQTGMPHAPVHWLTIQGHFNDLVVGTYGRGFYILDDVTPLQQLTPQVLASNAHFFKPRPAYRFVSVNRTGSSGLDPNVGQNPPVGASLNYYLKAAPKSEVSLTILDAAGKTVRQLTGPRRPGMNRVWWDLRYERTIDVQLRTTPPGNPHVWEEKRFKGMDWRPISYYGIDQVKQGPVVSPGEYTVRIRVDGQEFAQPLLVRKDPSSAGTEADITAQVKLALDIRDHVNVVADMTNTIEWVRKQLEDLRKLVVPPAPVLPTSGRGRRGAESEDMAPSQTPPRPAPTPEQAALIRAIDKLDSDACTVEDRLIQRTLEEADQKSFRGPIQLYLKWLWLAAEVGSGAADVAGGADFAPTAAELEVHALLIQRLDRAKADYDTLMQKLVPAFNETLRQQGMLHLVVPKGGRL
ncbi:MAG TPA: hypothetical protein VGK32_23315 [Vicinamibacterales bacterium]|jgi:photosystem II stability/assembly factor-like uncharacterized protein